MATLKVLLCVFIFNTGVYGWDDNSLDKVLTAIENGINWFDGKHTNLIMDAVTSNNIVQGQLSVLLNRINSGELKVPQRYLERINNIHDHCIEVRNKALPYSLHKVGNGNKHMKELATKDDFWRFYHPTRLADIMLLHTNKNQSAWDGTLTDHCTVQLVEGGCQITKECWDYITTPGAKMYFLTHQAFVFMNGEGAGCWKGEWYNKVVHQTHRICTNLLLEAMEESQHHVLLEKNTIRLDIFMERLGFCGILGHSQIAQPEWLDMILSWQIKPDGCWGDLNYDGKGPYHAFSDNPGVHCEDHQTAVGVISMTGFVRYIIEQVYNKGYPYTAMM